MLIEEVMDLINLKQEGNYWDFKREWYTDKKKADLLHDIICLSNNLENRDAYIIFGIDEEKDFEVIGIENDNHRRNTQMIVDFLKNKNFAGGIRPLVYVEILQLDGKSVDIIIIKNSNDTPFYLTKRYMDVGANQIYTRVMDVNTAKDSSADIKHIEYLWKKRFRLILSPLDRFLYYLKDKGNWVDAPNENRRYYKYFPEFIIENNSVSEERNGYEFYLFAQTDERPHWYDINLYYFQTLLSDCGGAALDGGRYFTSTPRQGSISIGKHIYADEDIVYKYIIKNSVEYTVHKFYYNADFDEEISAYNKFLKCVLFYSSEIEKVKFEQYVIENWKEDIFSEEEYILPNFPKLEGYRMEYFVEQYIRTMKLQKLLLNFREKSVSRKQ